MRFEPNDGTVRIQSIEDSPLWLDVQDIIDSSSYPFSHRYHVTIHTEKGDLPTLSLTNMDIERDYVNNIGDKITLEVVMALGTYLFKLYPYRDNLELTIRRDRNLDKPDQEPESVVERYRALFDMANNPEGFRPDLMVYGIDALDTSELVDVKFQLLDLALEPLRMKTTAGIFRDVTQDQVLQSLLPEEFNKIEVDGNAIIDALDIAEIENQEPRETLVIEDGTPVLGLATYLQDKSGGLYTGGVASYLQRYDGLRTFFIYPPLDLDKQDDRELIVYYLPPDKYEGLNRTFIKDGDVVKVLSTGDKAYKDEAEVGMIDKGSGFRAANQEAFMSKPVEITPEGVKADPTQLTHELILNERDDGVNYAPMLASKSTANLYRDVSTLKARDVAKEQFTWENADYDLIYPGMPVTIMSINRNEVQESYGVVESVQVLIERIGPMYAGKYYNTCVVTVVTKPREDAGDLPDIPFPDFEW